MLENVKITGGACFGAEPAALGPLEPVTFIFGQNGSGKTTISRAFAGYDSLSTECQWSNSLEMTPRVYNRDFIDRFLSESSRIPGVFVLGEQSGEAQRRLDEIGREGGERDAAETQLTAVSKSRDGKIAEKEEARDALKNAAWEKMQQLIRDEPSLKPAFVGSTGGVGNNKNKLADKLLLVPALKESDEPPELASLLTQAAAVFDESAQEISRIPLLKGFWADQRSGFRELGERLVGSDKVTLSELIEKLSNSDWVAHGQKYLEHSDGRCPFCQQPTPESLATHLAEMFDETYDAKVAAVREFAEGFEQWTEGLKAVEAAYSEEAGQYLDQANYAEAKAELLRVLSENSAALVRKQNTPSESIAWVPIDPVLEDLNQVIEEANQGIEKHNDLVRSRKQERPKLQDRCWQYLVHHMTATDITAYRSVESACDKALESLNQKVEQGDQRLEELEETVKKLQQDVESTRPVIDKINALLASSGFTSFHLVESEEFTNGYTLARESGEVKRNSLSEGERTFIAFLYYYHWLEGRLDEEDGASKFLAVIDDPISSLDSDILFIVSALIRKLMNRAWKSGDRLAQVILLTHNVYFYRDITHEGSRDGGGRRAYFVIRKVKSGRSVIEKHDENPIKTDYQRLWGEVRRATLSTDAISLVGLQNVMRRILETYFRIWGDGIWDGDIELQFTEPERFVYNALFKWSNEGSHEAVEDLHYTPSTLTQDTYLDVFRRVFEATRHEQHYNMMLYGKSSLAMGASDEPDQPKLVQGSEADS